VCHAGSLSSFCARRDIGGERGSPRRRSNAPLLEGKPYCQCQRARDNSARTVNNNTIVFQDTQTQTHTQTHTHTHTCRWNKIEPNQGPIFCVATGAAPVPLHSTQRSMLVEIEMETQGNKPEREGKRREKERERERERKREPKSHRQAVQSTRKRGNDTAPSLSRYHCISLDVREMARHC